MVLVHLLAGLDMITLGYSTQPDNHTTRLILPGDGLWCLLFIIAM